jgi:hypothetical protein
MYPVSETQPVVVTSTAKLPEFTELTTSYPLCVFSVNDIVIYTNATSASEGIYYCSLTANQVFEGKSAKINVDILYYTPQVATPQYPNIVNYMRKDSFASEAAPYIALIAPAPVLQGAQFSENGASVVISFDRAVQVIDASVYTESDLMTLMPLVDPISCASVFNPDALAYGKFEDTTLENGGCSISQNKLGTIDINLSGQFANTDLSALAVNDYVGLMNNTIAAGGEVFSKTATGKIQVASPQVVPSPQLQVLYSNIVTECSDVVWDFSISSTGEWSSSNVQRKWTRLD